MHVPSTKRVSTLFLKTVLVVIGFAVLTLAVFGFPKIWAGAPAEFPGLTTILQIGLIGIFLTVLPFWFALLQGFKILQNIDNNKAFSEESINALKTIKYCAIAMSALYAMALPLAYAFAELDDAPGVIVIATAYACAPLVIATFAAVLQTLVCSAVDVQAENDLTI